MKTMIETRNSKGESIQRMGGELANYDAALTTITSASADPTVHRVVIFEDNRPEDVVSTAHNPKYFTVRVDAQRNTDGEMEIIGTSWPT